MIKITEMGTYLYPDSNGHIQKIVHAGLIQAAWKPVVDSMIQFYQEQLGEDLLSVYIRGSVAKGGAVDFISDVDSFFVSKTISDIPKPAKIAFYETTKAKFPFVNGVEIDGRNLDKLVALWKPKARSVYHELIKTQAICVWGNDISDEIPPFLLSEMFAHVYGIEKELNGALAELDSSSEFVPEEMKNYCTWIMKRLLRTGFEIVMIREQKWTRDLYLCYQSFSKYYPEKEELMRKVLHLALNPSEDSLEMGGVLKEFQPWLSEEIKIQVLGVPHFYKSTKLLT